MNVTRNIPAQTRDRAKWLKLQALAERDAQDAPLQHLASLLRQAAGTNKRLFIALCQTVARDGVRYQLDTTRTGSEDIMGLTRPYTAPLEVLERGTDDCDAKGRLCVALLLAGGLRAKMVAWWDIANGDLDHVAGEVYLDGQWLHLETILSRARLGDEPQHVPVETSTGEWAYT